jgi:hypothetical protein
MLPTGRCRIIQEKPPASNCLSVEIPLLSPNRSSLAAAGGRSIGLGEASHCSYSVNFMFFRSTLSGGSRLRLASGGSTFT